jgi:hypothetical protein
MGVDEVQLDARVRPAQLGGRLRYERAEDRLETGESYPAGAKAYPGGQLDRCGVQPPEDLGRPLRQLLAILTLDVMTAGRPSSGHNPPK